MNRALIIIGVVIVLVGLFWKQLAGLPFFFLVPKSRPGRSEQLGGGSVGGVSWEHAWPAIRVWQA
jgi:hypothetical protein